MRKHLTESHHRTQLPARGGVLHDGDRVTNPTMALGGECVWGSSRSSTLQKSDVTSRNILMLYGAPLATLKN